MATKRKTKRRSKSNNPNGRPSKGLSEVAFLLKCPEQLRDDMKARAQALGISASEAWRRAAGQWVREGGF